MGYPKLCLRIAVVLFFTTVGCKKAINSIKEDLMVNLITSHTWKIVRFLEGSTNTTSQYVDYDFVFTKGNSVSAILNGVTVATGTWVGSETNQSITAAFPTAGAPLNRLTGVWLVTNTKSQPWRVYSNRLEGATKLVLDLQEK